MPNINPCLGAVKQGTIRLKKSSSLPDQGIVVFVKCFETPGIHLYQCGLIVRRAFFLQFGNVVRIQTRIGVALASEIVKTVGECRAVRSSDCVATYIYIVVIISQLSSPVACICSFSMMLLLEYDLGNISS